MGMGGGGGVSGCGPSLGWESSYSSEWHPLSGLTACKAVWWHFGVRALFMLYSHTQTQHHRLTIASHELACLNVVPRGVSVCFVCVVRGIIGWDGLCCTYSVINSLDCCGVLT